MKASLKAMTEFKCLDAFVWTSEHVDVVIDAFLFVVSVTYLLGI